VIINKIDRQDARPDEVLNEIFDLFVSLNATSEQLDFPVLYAVGRDGWCIRELGDEKKDLSPLFDLILEHVNPPKFNCECKDAKVLAEMEAVASGKSTLAM
jgi:GTP-binding protein